MAILSISECQQEYKGNLDLLARVVLFQYTFILTVLYIIVVDPNTKHLLFGLDFNFTYWAFIANLGIPLINYYIGGRLRYLAELAAMYPQQRRPLRFITRHHHWFLNPFSVSWFSYKRPVANTIPYIFIVMFGLLPITEMFDTDPAFQALLKGQHFWSYYLPVVLLILFHFSSYYFLINSIGKLGEILWKGKYWPSHNPDTRKPGTKNQQTSSSQPKQNLSESPEGAKSK